MCWVCGRWDELTAITDDSCLFKEHGGDGKWCLWSALLSWVLAVGVYHHSRNGLLLCFSYSFTSFFCCFLARRCNFCVPWGWTGFDIWLFRQKCQWAVVKSECRWVISVPTCRCLTVESRVWESEVEYVTALPCWWWLVRIYPRETKAFLLTTPQRDGRTLPV